MLKSLMCLVGGFKTPCDKYIEAISLVIWRKHQASPGALCEL